MDIVIVWFIGVIVFFIIIIILLVLYLKWDKIRFYYLYKNKRDVLVRCLFIMPNTTIKEVYLTHDSINFINYNKGCYKVIRELGLFTEKFQILTMLYYYGNPNPLNLKNMRADNIPQIDAEAVKLSLRAEFLKNKLKENLKSLILIIMVGLNILISIVIALKLFGVFDKK